MKIRITAGMLMALIINMMYAKGIGVTQGIAAREAGSEIWVSTLFAIVQGAGVAWLTAAAVIRCGDRELIDGAGFVMGKWAGKAVALLSFVFFTGAFATIMLTFVYHLMDYFLPQFPTFSFILVALWVGGLGAFHGLEVMARTAFVGVFTILLLNISLLTGSLTEFDIRNLAPIFEYGVWKSVWASRNFDTDWAMGTMAAGIVIPLVSKRDSWSRASVISVLMGGLLVLMWPILETGVLSAEVTGQYVVSCMQLARSAHLGFFIQRYEMIMICFFATSSLVQIMVCLFCASHSLSKVVGLKDYRPMLIPACLLLGASSYWVVADHTRAMTFAQYYWPPVALGLAVLLPAVLLLGGTIKGKMGGKKGNTPDTGSNAQAEEDADQVKEQGVNQEQSTEQNPEQKKKPKRMLRRGGV
ncbi:MAG: spore gernimation protein [Paenibacillaceae bacterium]|nr:spore gernimation protein [Paenibacillaceae bacterium]